MFAYRLLSVFYFIVIKIKGKGLWGVSLGAVFNISLDYSGIFEK